MGNFRYAQKSLPDFPSSGLVVCSQMNVIKVSIDLLGTLSTLDKQSPIMHQLDIFTSLELHQELLGYGVGIFWASANEFVVVVWGSLWSRS